MRTQPPASRRPFLFLHLLLLAASAALLALHYVHLRADFPNFSRWMDWSKYTDEGWYGDAAIRHFQLGHWNVPGDFNPAAALPVWPTLEALVFRFSGVSLTAARALTVTVFAGTLAATWLLLTRAARKLPAPKTASPSTLLAAPAAVLLLAASPFCFVFNRLAILEPLLVFLMLLALLAAQSVRIPPDSRTATLSHRLRHIFRTNAFPLAALALLLPALVLTKTTALFLVPAIAWMLFAACGYSFTAFLLAGLPTATAGLALWLAWFLGVVRPHYLLDYRYLFSANAYTGITRDNALQTLADTFKDGLWIGPILFPAALAAIALCLIAAFRRPRFLLAQPLLPTLILWAAGYTAFLAYHANLQPRYYLVVAVPLTLLVPATLGALLSTSARPALTPRLGLAAAALLIAAIALPDALQTVRFLRHPSYTLVDAAHALASTIASYRRDHPTHSPLVLSISGSDLSLITGLPSIDDDFGTLELADRVRQYRPGWYAAWNQLDDDKMDAIAPLYRIERVAAFPAMDDPDRNLLILYRLDPTPPTPPRHRPGCPTPRQLRTRVGQQPSTTQLEH